MIIILIIIMRVLAVEISCPHSLNNRAKKDFEKTEKYQPLFFFGGGVGGGSKELDVEMSTIFGVRLRDILKRMQKAVLLCSMNIARTLKVILKYGHRPGFQVL